MIYETKFIISLGLTLVIEVPLAYILIRFLLKEKKIKAKKIIVVSIIASAVTLPYLWFILPSFVDARLYLYIGEALMILIEALIFNQLLDLKMEKALLTAFIINIVSYYFGLNIIHMIF